MMAMFREVGFVLLVVQNVTYLYCMRLFCYLARALTKLSSVATSQTDKSFRSQMLTLTYNYLS